jgi:hypothetical protein
MGADGRHGGSGKGDSMSLIGRILRQIDLDIATWRLTRTGTMADVEAAWRAYMAMMPPCPSMLRILGRW